jgi:uncharacterized membrane protein YhaH (DUF805 family)
MDFSRLLSFHGRIRRSEWWLAQLVAWGALLATAITLGVASDHGRADDGLIALPIVSAVGFATFITLSSGVKRLHDLDLSGWLVLLLFVPAIGWLIAVVVFGILPGTPGANQHGLPSEDLERNPLAGIMHD